MKDKFFFLSYYSIHLFKLDDYILRNTRPMARYAQISNQSVPLGIPDACFSLSVSLQSSSLPIHVSLPVFIAVCFWNPEYIKDNYWTRVSNSDIQSINTKNEYDLNFILPLDKFSFDEPGNNFILGK